MARLLRGETAIASAKVAHKVYLEMVSGDRFQALASRGARPQRVLWASTGTKDPSYSDTRYVEALIGPDTINTMPLETLAAYRDHGKPALRLEQGGQQAVLLLDRLAELGIDLKAVTRQLEDEGVAKFIAPFDRLLQSIEVKRLQALK
jgi:transaldolase